MSLKDEAINLQSICQDFLDSKLDAHDFKTTVMTAAFSLAGVSDEEMKVFNSVLQSLYRMKKIGRDEIVDIFPVRKEEEIHILKVEEL